MKYLLNVIQNLFVVRDSIELEYECNQVQNYNNFEQKVGSKSKDLYKVCGCKNK